MIIEGSGLLWSMEDMTFVKRTDDSRAIYSVGKAQILPYYNTCSIFGGMVVNVLQRMIYKGCR